MRSLDIGVARWLMIVAALFAATIMVAACGGPENIRGKSPAAGNNRHGADQQRRNIEVRGLQGIPEGDRHLFTDPNNPLSTRTIYFDLDSSNIPSRFSGTIQAHARYLANHPKVHLRLEGNTDERGTREYNVALGQRRAESVKQSLVVSGANAAQITTISFGEERPAVMGHTKQAYAKNRRVKLIYTDQ